MEAFAFWNGSFVPSKTRPYVVAKIHTEIAMAVA
jgi:hypothetical protein